MVDQVIVQDRNAGVNAMTMRSSVQSQSEPTQGIRQAKRGSRIVDLTSRRSTLRSPHTHVARNGEPSTGTQTQEERLAQGLGWFGIGLGLMELVAPHQCARMAGLPSGHRTLIQVMGLREMASGFGIVTQSTSAAAVWLRVVGDMVDLACLSAAFMSRRADRTRLTTTLAAVVGATVLDVVTAQQLSRGVKTRNGAVRLTASTVIDRSREELYRFWRDFSNLPRFMKHVRQVDLHDERRSHWIATGPADATVEWDAEITEDLPHESIAWRSIDGTVIDQAGTVRFEPAIGNRGTIVTVDLEYRLPLGTVGAAVAAWFGKDPRQTVNMDLRRFKQMMETGDVITTEGQPAGRDESTSWKYDRAVR